MSVLDVGLIWCVYWVCVDWCEDVWGIFLLFWCVEFLCRWSLCRDWSDCWSCWWMIWFMVFCWLVWFCVVCVFDWFILVLGCERLYLLDYLYGGCGSYLSFWSDWREEVVFLCGLVLGDCWLWRRGVLLSRGCFFWWSSFVVCRCWGVVVWWSWIVFWWCWLLGSGFCSCFLESRWLFCLIEMFCWDVWFWVYWWCSCGLRLWWSLCWWCVCGGRFF